MFCFFFAVCGLGGYLSCQHQFKARPYNPDGFGVGGEQGVFRPQHSDKTLTQPAPFRLSTDGRASKRAPRYSVFRGLSPCKVAAHENIVFCYASHSRSTLSSREEATGATLQSI